MELFGTQLKQAGAGLSGTGDDRVRVVMQVVVSLALLPAGIYVILVINNEATQKLASGWIGAVLGYWLKYALVIQISEPGRSRAPTHTR